MATDDRKFLTYDEAVKRLPDGEYVHTFLNPNGFMLLGADWKKSEVLRRLKAHENTIEETGPQAMAMGHGLAFHDGEKTVFVQTRKYVLEKSE